MGRRPGGNSAAGAAPAGPAASMLSLLREVLLNGGYFNLFISLELVYSQDNDKICKACISRYRITSTWNWKSTVLLASHENQEKATRIRNKTVFRKAGFQENGNLRIY